MMSPSQEQNLAALLTASRNGDVDSVASLWRELTPVEQERVLLRLLGMQAEATVTAVDSDEEPDLVKNHLGDTAAMPVVDDTELIPESLEDLRGLTASEVTAPQAVPVVPVETTAYRSRWIRRWKWSALVAAWAVTTIFAFTADVSAYGPMEWVVAISASVVGGGLLVGTLINFAVAAIPTHEPVPKPTQRTGT